MGILFGLIGLAVTATILAVINMFLNFDFLGFSLWFIIPVGGLISGWFMSFIYTRALKITNKKVQKHDYIINIIMAILLFVGTYYIVYSLTFVDLNALDDKHMINYEGKGIHISQILGEGKTLSFIDYMEKELENSSRSVRLKTVETFKVQNSTVNYIYFVLSFVGVLVGSAIAVGVTQDSKYCDRCKRYMKEGIEFLKIPVDESIEAKINEVDQILKAQYMDDQEKILDMMDKYPIKAKCEANFFKGELDYCTTCKEGIVTITLMRKNTKGGYEKDNKVQYTYKIYGSTTKKILEKMGK